MLPRYAYRGTTRATTVIVTALIFIDDQTNCMFLAAQIGLKRRSIQKSRQAGKVDPPWLGARSSNRRVAFSYLFRISSRLFCKNLNLDLFFLLCD